MTQDLKQVGGSAAERERDSFVERRRQPQGVLSTLEVMPGEVAGCEPHGLAGRQPSSIHPVRSPHL